MGRASSHMGERRRLSGGKDYTKEVTLFWMGEDVVRLECEQNDFKLNLPSELY